MNRKFDGIINTASAARVAKQVSNLTETLSLFIKFNKILLAFETEHYAEILRAVFKKVYFRDVIALREFFIVVFVRGLLG